MKSSSPRTIVLRRESAALPVAASLLVTGIAIAILGNAYSILIGPGPLSASPVLAFLAIAHLAVGAGFFAAGLVAMGRALKKAPDRRVWLGALAASVALAAVVAAQAVSFWMPPLAQ